MSMDLAKKTYSTTPDYFIAGTTVSIVTAAKEASAAIAAHNLVLLDGGKVKPLAAVDGSNALNVTGLYGIAAEDAASGNGMRELPGRGNRSKAFLVEFHNKNGNNHIGMVQRVIGSKSEHTRTKRDRPRWRNSKGNVEKLVTLGSPSITAMHHTIWPEVEPSVEEYLQERLQAQVERVLARAGKK